MQPTELSRDSIPHSQKPLIKGADRLLSPYRLKRAKFSQINTQIINYTQEKHFAALCVNFIMHPSHCSLRGIYKKLISIIISQL